MFESLFVSTSDSLYFIGLSRGMPLSPSGAQAGPAVSSRQSAQSSPFAGLHSRRVAHSSLNKEFLMPSQLPTSTGDTIDSGTALSQHVAMRTARPAQKDVPCTAVFRRRQGNKTAHRPTW
eukprot:6209391-Pleurochrysis_carterae.AAC.1